VSAAADDRGQEDAEGEAAEQDRGRDHAGHEGLDDELRHEDPAGKD
jgi:hypothetical protein